jgi:hypothetical protein
MDGGAWRVLAFTREKLKESRKILAYPYFRPLGQPGAAALYTSSTSGKLPSCLFLSAFICVHLRPIWGFGFRIGPEEKHIWPQMNADERG